MLLRKRLRGPGLPALFTSANIRSNVVSPAAINSNTVQPSPGTVLDAGSSRNPFHAEFVVSTVYFFGPN